MRNVLKYILIIFELKLYFKLNVSVPALKWDLIFLQANIKSLHITEDSSLSIVLCQFFVFVQADLDLLLLEDRVATKSNCSDRG